MSCVKSIWFYEIIIFGNRIFIFCNFEQVESLFSHERVGRLQKINQTDTAVVISGVTKSAVGSGRKIQRTPSITSWNREIKIPKGVNPDSGPVLTARNQRWAEIFHTSCVSAF